MGSSGWIERWDRAVGSSGGTTLWDRVVRSGWWDRAVGSGGAIGRWDRVVGAREIADSTCEHPLLDPGPTEAVAEQLAAQHVSRDEQPPLQLCRLLDLKAAHDAARHAARHAAYQAGGSEGDESGKR